ncbi:hypothetical protein HK102_001386, partial [Quaeritorhiza haematococci]
IDYKICQIAFKDKDIDLVLVRGTLESELELILGSLKLSQGSFLELRSNTGLSETTAFCKDNVAEFLRTKVPPSARVSKCLIVAVTADPAFHNAHSVEASFVEGLELLQPDFPHISFDYALWTLEDLLAPLRLVQYDNSMSVYPSRSELNWPILPRNDAEEELKRLLASGRSCMITGSLALAKQPW